MLLFEYALVGVSVLEWDGVGGLAFLAEGL